jgi:hypothetical protein
MGFSAAGIQQFACRAKWKVNRRAPCMLEPATMAVVKGGLSWTTGGKACSAKSRSPRWPAHAGFYRHPSWPCVADHGGAQRPEKNQWAVVVHPLDTSQTQAAPRG